MTTAFVLTGGASLGAIQVGMLQALSERGIRPDLLVGTSAGALNAAFVAGSGTGDDVLDCLAQLWVGMRRSTLFPLQPTRAVLSSLGLRPSVCSAAGLERFITDNLDYERFEDTVVPLHIVTADLLSGREVVLARGDVRTALMASCAIPGLYPPVVVDGHQLGDGVLAENSGISVAVRAGADRVYLLTAGTACALTKAPRHPLAASLHAVTLLLAQRARQEAMHFASEVDLHVLPPLCPLAVSGADFGHAAELIGRARRSSLDWLDDGMDRSDRADPAATLSLHHHRLGPSGVALRDSLREAPDLHGSGASRKEW